MSDMIKKLIYGIGVNDYKDGVKEDNRQIKSYSTWIDMLGRCYSSRIQNKNKSYIGCSVCDEWLYFSNFKLWFDENYIEGFDLDKDVLFEGNKVYSPETCRYVPRYINILISKKIKNQNQGIRVRNENSRNSTYEAHCSDGRGKRLFKTFKTLEEAINHYATIKKHIVKEHAIKAFLANEIKTDIYLALIRREWK